MNARAQQRAFYVPGPLGPDALADALRAVHVQLFIGLGNHDVYSALYDADRVEQTGYLMAEFEQIARAVLAALSGIGALETRDPVRALQIWQAKNTDSSLAWAFGEAVASISPQDRAAVELSRAEQRGAHRTQSG